MPNGSKPPAASAMISAALDRAEHLDDADQGVAVLEYRHRRHRPLQRKIIRSGESEETGPG